MGPKNATGAIARSGQKEAKQHSKMARQKRQNADANPLGSWTAARDKGLPRSGAGLGYWGRSVDRALPAQTALPATDPSPAGPVEGPIQKA